MFEGKNELQRTIETHSPFSFISNPDVITLNLIYLWLGKADK